MYFRSSGSRLFAETLGAGRDLVLLHPTPLDHAFWEPVARELSGRYRLVLPDLRGHGRSEAGEGMIGMTENVFINTKNRSHTITATVRIPQGGADGVILCQAGRFGGWSLYVKDHKPIYAYNYLGRDAFKIASPRPLPEGQVTIRFEFVYDGGGLGKGGNGTILINGEKLAEGRLPMTQGYFFSADEGADVGLDGETPVTDDYKERDNKFTGKIDKVTIELK